MKYKFYKTVNPLKKLLSVNSRITLVKDEFETRFVEVLNRSGGGETDNINKEFIILAILDGKR